MATASYPRFSYLAVHPGARYCLIPDGTSRFLGVVPSLLPLTGRDTRPPTSYLTAHCSGFSLKAIPFLLIDRNQHPTELTALVDIRPEKHCTALW